MTPASRRPRFEPLRSATPPSGAQNAHHSIEQVVQFSMSPPVQFRMSFDSRNTDRVDRIGSLPLKGGGQEGVGAASTGLRASETTTYCKSRRAEAGSALAGRLVAAPTASCPPPFRVRDANQPSRSILRGNSARRRRAEMPGAMGLPSEPASGLRQ